MAEALTTHHAVEPHYRRKQHGVSLSVWDMQRRSRLVRHRMAQAQPCAGKRHPGHTGSQQHAFARRQILTVADGLRQRFTYHRNRANRQTVGKWRRVQRAIRFNGVRQCINPGHCRYMCRHAFRQCSVQDRHIRHQGCVGQHFFESSRGVDYYRDVGGF